MRYFVESTISNKFCLEDQYALNDSCTLYQQAYMGQIEKKHLYVYGSA